MYPYLAYLFLLQSPAQQAGVPLREDCSNSSAVLANLAASASVEVRSSFAGYEKPCYAVTAIIDGKAVRGYVQGTGLAAVAEYQRQQTAFSASVINVLPPAAAPAPEPTNMADTSPLQVPQTLRLFRRRLLDIRPSRISQRPI